jgi:hypothetical protein
MAEVRARVGGRVLGPKSDVVAPAPVAMSVSSNTRERVQQAAAAIRM